MLALGLLTRRPGSPKPCRRAPSSLSMTAFRNQSRCACHMLCWRLLPQSCFVSCNSEACVQFGVSFVCWCWSALLEAIMTAHLDSPSVQCLFLREHWSFRILLHVPPSPPSLLGSHPCFISVISLPLPHLLCVRRVCYCCVCHCCVSGMHAHMVSSSCKGVVADAGANALDDRALRGSSKVHE